jgi:hypothetical protein
MLESMHIVQTNINSLKIALYNSYVAQFPFKERDAREVGVGKGQSMQLMQLLLNFEVTNCFLFSLWLRTRVLGIQE